MKLNWGLYFNLKPETELFADSFECNSKSQSQNAYASRKRNICAQKSRNMHYKKKIYVVMWKCLTWTAGLVNTLLPVTSC